MPCLDEDNAAKSVFAKFPVYVWNNIVWNLEKSQSAEISVWWTNFNKRVGHISVKNKVLDNLN